MTSPRLISLLATTALVGLAADAMAQTGPHPPFVGEQFEGFETQHFLHGGQHPAGGAPTLIGGLFGATATLEALSSPFLIQLGGSTHASCNSLHRTGNIQLGSFLGGCAIQFDVEQSTFGGYFASDNSDPMNATSREWDVKFFDALGIQLGATELLMMAPCGESSWHGWGMPGGTRRIEIEPRVTFTTLVMDDLMVSTSPPLGETHCVSGETSLSERGYCGASGSSVAAMNSLTLHATMLPQNAFGYFLVSRDPGLVAHPAGSAGTLCLSGSIGRFVGPGQIMNSGANGAFSHILDLTAIPQPGGPTAIQAGQTWYFQAWFRDVTTTGQPMPTSNFTSGLMIAFD